MFLILSAKFYTTQILDDNVHTTPASLFYCVDISSCPLSSYEGHKLKIAPQFRLHNKKKIISVA